MNLKELANFNCDYLLVTRRSNVGAGIQGSWDWKRLVTSSTIKAKW